MAGYIALILRKLSVRLFGAPSASELADIGAHKDAYRGVSGGLGRGFARCRNLMCLRVSLHARMRAPWAVSCESVSLRYLALSYKAVVEAVGKETRSCSIGGS